MQNDVLQHQLQIAAAKAQGPLAQAALQKELGALQLEKSQLLPQLALRRAMMGMAGGNGMQDPTNTKGFEDLLGNARMTNPELAKQLEPLLVPGVGVAKIPVPQAIRDDLIGKQKLMAGLNDLHQFINTHSTPIATEFSPEYNAAQVKIKTLQSAIRDGTLGTVYREGEQPLLDKFINSNPAGLLKKIKTEPQIKELLNSTIRDANITKGNYGLPQTPNQDADQQPKQMVIKGVPYNVVNGKLVKAK
jgi:hypothetical protein